jgi:uncharacterized protein (UPF0210 family)
MIWTQDETEPEQDSPMPFTIHDILMKCISHKDNKELIAMMVSALQDRGVDDVMEFQNMNWETISKIRLQYHDGHAVKDLKESMKKVREYCKLVQIFPCSDCQHHP